MASPLRPSAHHARRRYVGLPGRRGPHARRIHRPAHYTRTATRTLGRFRQATRLAVSATAFLLLLATILSPPTAGAQEMPAEQAGPANTPGDAVEEATGTIRDLFLSFYGLLPKILIALGILIAAYALARLIRLLVNRRLGKWIRADAVSALTSVTISLIALGAALSVLAGDVRALVGAVGLVGLALSWALQAPIESFTGWLLNAFKSYYRVGDRIAVGEIFGDVYQIDVLTTTVWDAGGPNQAVQGAQPTGALVTFPNAEVLRASIVNYTRDFPYVWDEITISIANESDVTYAMNVVRQAATAVIGAEMKEPAQEYARLLEQRRLDAEVDAAPAVYMSPTDSWTNLTIRYLVAVRQRRRWSTALQVAIGQELARPEHGDKIRPAYPRTQVEMLDR